MKLKPDAILFDMDGVLVDSLDSWLSALNVALKNFKQKELSREEFIKKYWGHDLYDNLEKMGLSREIGSFCNKIYGEHVKRIEIYPDTKDTLQKLREYKKGIITNTPKDCTLEILKEFNIEQFFEIIITSDEVTRAKPSPEIVLRACNFLKVKPKNVVLIGDTDSDVKAGKAAGCTVVGINIDADYIIRKLSDLTDLIDAHSLK